MKRVERGSKGSCSRLEDQTCRSMMMMLFSWWSTSFLYALRCSAESVALHLFKVGEPQSCLFEVEEASMERGGRERKPRGLQSRDAASSSGEESRSSCQLQSRPGDVLP